MWIGMLVLAMIGFGLMYGLVALIASSDGGDA
jgi:hypothetical protein